jgi:hypothetical protein
MNSIPQQAVAKGKGQSELDRAQATIVSSRVVRMSPTPPLEDIFECVGRGAPFAMPGILVSAGIPIQI